MSYDYKIDLHDLQIITNLNNGPRDSYIDIHNVQCVQMLNNENNDICNY